MKYSDLAGKEIIDIDEGTRLGIVSESDLVIDSTTGNVQSIIIPYRVGFLQRKELMVPWYGIKKIGVDLIIVDLSTVESNFRKNWS